MRFPFEVMTFTGAAGWKRRRLARTLAAPTVLVTGENQMRSHNPAASGWRNGGPGFSPARRRGLPPGAIARRHGPSTAPPHRIIDEAAGEKGGARRGSGAVAETSGGRGCIPNFWVDVV